MKSSLMILAMLLATVSLANAGAGWDIDLYGGAVVAGENTQGNMKTGITAGYTGIGHNLIVGMTIEQYTQVFEYQNFGLFGRFYFSGTPEDDSRLYGEARIGTITVSFNPDNGTLADIYTPTLAAVLGWESKINQSWGIYGEFSGLSNLDSPSEQLINDATMAIGVRMFIR